MAKLNLKNILITATKAELDFHLCPGMKVEIAYASKTVLENLREKSQVQKFDTETGTPFKSIDNDLYVKNYAETIVLGWKGFTGAHLASLVLVDETELDLEAEIDFDQETAVFLMANCPAFDRWVVNSANALENFRRSK